MDRKLSLTEQLQHYFGFDRFKGQQEEAVKSVMDGKDTFVLMPTGGGKSLIYQLPALVARRHSDCNFATYCFNEKPGGFHTGNANRR